MKLKIVRFLTVVLVSQLIIQPAFAIDAYGKRVNLPTAAPITDNSGMSFRKNEADTLLKNQAQENFEQDIIPKGAMMQDPSIAGLIYQVHILGEVRNPGTYRIAASDRLSEVLLRAGGIVQQGSQRNIEVRRAGEMTRKIDLLAFQLNGNLENNPYLLDNDVVYVPLRRGTIQVVGAVLRPREYEIKREKSLQDAIALAGGTSIGATRDSPIKVIRFVDNKKDIIDIPQTEADITNFQIQNGDVIFIPHMITEKNRFDFDLPKLPGDNIFYPSFEDRVFILGGVEAPGAYPFNPYYSISQYLSLAGGYTKLSTHKIHVITPEGKKAGIRKKNMDTFTINPGDTILIGERRIAPEGWVSILMSVAGFGLSTTSTILLLKDKY